MIDDSSPSFQVLVDDTTVSDDQPSYYGRNPSHQTKDFDTSFSFPARPSATPVRHGRHASVTNSQSRPAARSHQRGASQDHRASAMNQLHSFSFPNTTVEPSPRPATIAAFDNSATTTPTRSAGRGHRRTASEFVGGDSRMGSATKLRHASVDGGSLVPGIAINEAFEPFPRPAGPAHGRRPSVAATQQQQPSAPTAQEIDLDDAVNHLERRESGEQTPRAKHGIGSGSSFTMHSANGIGPNGRQHSRTSSTGFTPTRRSMPRARVGFADRVDFMPRPLSTISSQSGGSMSTIRHSMSVSSASGYHANSPLRMDNQSYVSPSPDRLGLPTRPRSTDPVLTPTTAGNGLDIRAGTEAVIRPKSAQAFTEFSSPTKAKDSTSKTRVAPSSRIVSTKPKRKIGTWAHILGRHSKSTLPPHVNSHQLNIPALPDCSPELSPEPAPVELNIDFNEDPTAVVSDPAQISSSMPVQTDSFILRPKVSTIMEEPNRTSTMIDLDLALDLFTSTPSKTPRSRNFSSARKSMHSGSGVGGLSSPSGHRRSESAPSHLTFDPDQYRTAHDGSTTGQSFEMEDVFEEDESKATDVSLTVPSQANPSISMPTSFEGDRLTLMDGIERPASARAEQAHIRFDDPARRLQFHRNSTGGFLQFRRHSQTSGVGRPATSSMETVKALQKAAPTSPQICFSHVFDDAGQQQASPSGIKQKTSFPSHLAIEPSLPSESSSPFTSSQAGFDQQHRGSTTTMATSYVESTKSPSIGIGEPGPEIRLSEDVIAPMVEQRPATSRTPLQPLNVNSRPRGMRSVSSTMSLASAADSISRRKRTSLGNLSRLLSGNKSALSVSNPEENNSRTPRTPKSSNRFSRVLRFWRPRPSPS